MTGENTTELLGCPFKGSIWNFRQGLQDWTTRIREDGYKPCNLIRNQMAGRTECYARPQQADCCAACVKPFWNWS